MQASEGVAMRHKSSRGVTRRHQASHFAKDTSSKLKAAAAGDSSTSSDDDDDRCRIIPATADDDYLERLDQKVLEVISRSRLGNISANLDHSKSSSEHFGQLPLNLHGRTSSAKKSALTFPHLQSLFLKPVSYSRDAEIHR